MRMSGGSPAKRDRVTRAESMSSEPVMALIMDGAGGTSVCSSAFNVSDFSLVSSSAGSNISRHS